MRNFIFSFDFDNDSRETYGFPILSESNFDDDAKDDTIVEACEKRDLEHLYGVHDISFGDNDIWGWNSYEVPKDKVLELMGIWKEIMTELGCVCGDITRMENE